VSGFFLHPTRGILEVAGKDRGAFLHGLFSQDTAKNFPTGKVVYGIFPNSKGKVFADVLVYHAPDEKFLLDLEYAFASPLLNHLERYLILMEATVKEVSLQFSVFSILGENEKIFPHGDFPCEAFWAFVQKPRWQEWRIWADKTHERKILNWLQTKGIPALSQEEYEMLEVERGVPKLGHELDETIFPQEAGLEEALNFSKGCFLGAEVLQRIYYQGHVNRALALFGSGSNKIPEKASLFQDDIEVGKVSRCVFSKQYNQFVFLAIVKITCLDTGKSFCISLNNALLSVSLLQAFRHIKA
jgi:folate-binding protein YgfZ